MKALVNMMMEYNHWANNRLYQDCSKVPAEIFHRNLGAEYESMHKTLDHILLADLLWLDRFKGKGDKFTSFKQVITSSFDDLQERRDATDEELTRFCQEITEAGLSKMVHFKTILDPAELEQPVGGALLLLFHLQSHYRAQVQAQLNMHGFQSRALNLMTFQRQTGLGLMG